MALTPDDVRRIARLAHLDVDEEEATRMAAEMDAMLGYVDRLSEVDTAGVEPLAHVHDAACPLREDAVDEARHLGGETAVSIAPDAEGTSFRVPAIIKSRGSA